jgi:hypothetical protein
MDLLQTVLSAAAGLTGLFAVLAAILALAFAAALVVGAVALVTAVLGLFGLAAPCRRKPPPASS